MEPDQPDERKGCGHLVSDPICRLPGARATIATKVLTSTSLVDMLQRVAERCAAMHHIEVIHLPQTEVFAVPTKIEEIEFFTQSEVADLLGVDRTTLWRWRKHGKVPPGRRFRGSQVLYTRAEVKRIKEYSHRMEPITPETESNQMRLPDDGEHRA